MQLHTNRNGFALPMVIMVIGFMTAGVLAAFARTSSEVVLVDNQRAQTASFAVAEAGLQQFMATAKLPKDDDYLAASYTYAGGSAQVTATQVRPERFKTDTTIWLIRSVGTMGAASGRPVGARTVAQLAYRVKGTMQALSSWTSLSGLRKNGASGDMSGSDACSDSTVAGVAVPNGLLTGKDDAISGDPDVLEMGTPAQMAAKINIDWVGIVNPANPAINADIIVCRSGTYGYDANLGPCGSWPTSTQWTNYRAQDYWPTIMINGSAALPSNGQGTLIVTGDLTFGGGDRWDGIIMVGGKITDNGSGNIAGAVVSGLNMKRPAPWPSTVTESSRANGTKDYTFDSCAIENAANGQSRIIQISNAWIDTWSW